MRMTASELGRYRGELEQTARAAREYVLRRLDEEGQGLDVAGMRELAIEIVEDATGVFGDVAQDIACELFDEVMEADGETARATTFDGLIDHGRTEEKVRYYACALVDGDREGFDGRSADLAAYYVHRSAWDNLVRNCDLGHVRWARVPTGRDTCPTCLKLASRGFRYHSQDSAMRGKHRGCDCVVVPGSDGATIEGYDPDELYDLWKASEEIEADEALSRSERKAARRALIAEELERRRLVDMSDEARAVEDSARFVEQFGSSVAMDMASAIDGAIKSGDPDRANAARLLAKDIAEGFEVESVTADGSKFIPATGEVRFSPDGAHSTRTIAHELAHRRDFVSELNYTARKIGRDGMEDVTLATSAGKWSSMEFELDNKTLASRFRANGRGVTPAWRDLKKRLGVKTDAEAEKKLHELRRAAGLTEDAAESLSDIIHAASNGQIRFRHGHFDRTDADGNTVRDARGNPVPYWDGTTRVIEVWADYSASLVVSERESRLIRQLFPDECAIMDAMMEVMVK